jgi:hypothetical protein
MVRRLRCAKFSNSPRLRRCAAHTWGVQGERKREDGGEGNDYENLNEMLSRRANIQVQRLGAHMNLLRHPLNDSLDFLDSVCWLSLVKHSMAICADWTQIFDRVEFIPLLNFGQWLEMMNVNKTFANLTVSHFKIEATNRAI